MLYSYLGQGWRKPSPAQVVVKSGTLADYKPQKYGGPRPAACDRNNDMDEICDFITTDTRKGVMALISKSSIIVQQLINIEVYKSVYEREIRRSDHLLMNKKKI